MTDTNTPTDVTPVLRPDSPRHEPPNTPSAGAALAKGILLVVGGAALGFFGCLGALTLNSIGGAVVAVLLGAAVIVAGAIMLVVAIVRGVKSKL